MDAYRNLISGDKWWEKFKVFVPGGCYLDIIIIRKIDQKSRCSGTFDVRILPDRLEASAGMGGAVVYSLLEIVLQILT